MQQKHRAIEAENAAENAYTEVELGHQVAEIKADETIQHIEMEKRKVAVINTLTLQFAKKKKKSMRNSMNRNSAYLVLPTREQ